MTAEVWAIIGTGFCAAAIALWGIFTQRAITRRHLTIEHLTKMEADKDIIGAQQRFIELARSNGGLSPFAEQDNESDPDTQKIKTVLNQFELIAIGISTDSIDARLYRQWYRSGVTRYWGHAQPFIRRLRDRLSNEQLYVEFERLAAMMQSGKAPREWRWRRLR